MIAIIDYGVGNLFSLSSSLRHIGYNDVVVSGDKDVIKSADKLILPGVGAFADAVLKLKESGLDKVVIEEARGGKPLLGICLGMQLLFERSFEYGEHRGLGLIEGDIMPLEDDIDKSLKVPHIGWNALHILKDCPILKYVNEKDCVYYVHSYYAKNCDSAVVATSEYGVDVVGTVQKDNVFGCQFHPEKSGDVGLKILRAFCELGE